MLKEAWMKEELNLVMKGACWRPPGYLGTGSGAFTGREMLPQFTFVTTVDSLSEFMDAWAPASMFSAVTVPCSLGRRERRDVPAVRNLCRK